MPTAKHSNTLRHSLIAIWLLVIIGALYVYFFQKSLIANQLAGAFGLSVAFGYALYLIMCSLRGFTLIPSTYTIIVGLLFFRPVPLYILTMLGILISSSLIYFFSESLHLHEIFERKHKREVEKITSFLRKNELAVVIAWSFFPLLPTDVICYVCGILEVDYKKFLFGVFIGEGIICALYIFLGVSFLQFLHLVQ